MEKIYLVQFFLEKTKAYHFVRKSLLILFMIIPMVFICSCINHENKKTVGFVLKSGERISVGTNHRRGPLAIGLQSNPVGQAYVFDNKEPDLFVISSKHSLQPNAGLYLYKWIERDEEGTPVFGQRQIVDLPEFIHNNSDYPFINNINGTIFQTTDGVIHGWWLDGRKIYRTIFDRKELEFKLSSSGIIEIEGLPDISQFPNNLSVIQHNNSEAQIILGINDKKNHRPKGYWRDPDYHMFDGAGIFLGSWPFEYLYISDTFSLDVKFPIPFSQYSTTREEVLHGYKKITVVEYGKDKGNQLVTGSWYGNIMYYPLLSGNNSGKYLLICDLSGIAHRHKTIGPTPIAYPNPNTGLLSDLIVGGESELTYYRFTGKFHYNGSPIYHDPVPILEQDAKLYTGSLPVINVVDWDNNEHLDIIAGNSEGRVLLFLNVGTNEKPAFMNAKSIYAGNRPIHIQPGYRGSIQGPAEARFGYSCPKIVDWNEDGLFDIVMSSATGCHEVFLNIGNLVEPKFAQSVPIYYKGLDLHGTWRVQPGVKKLGERMAYVTLDDDDEFHFYWQIDPYNVEDGGKLYLDNDSAICANFLSAGGTGRLKIVLTDWDVDGKIDMLVGTPRHGSVPNPKDGLPQSKGLKGAAVLFLKNVGTDKKSVFAFPKLMRFRGEPIYLGQHACSPEVWDYGQPNGPDLLVGEQDGRIRYYARKDLSWD